MGTLPQPKEFGSVLHPWPLRPFPGSLRVPWAAHSARSLDLFAFSALPWKSPAWGRGSHQRSPPRQAQHPLPLLALTLPRVHMPPAREHQVQEQGPRLPRSRYIPRVWNHAGRLVGTDICGLSDG